ncbi:MAG: stage II sporulation protein M [Halobacteriales archaeon]|nr:stage II sporulation protein M [Halobacteriales archaeon]
MADGEDTSSSTDTGGRLRRRRVRTVLARWCYPYFPLAVATFVVGGLAGGAAMAVVSADALAAAAETVDASSLFPAVLTPWTIFANNVVVVALIALGGISFGLLTVVVLFFNGVVLGIVLVGSAGEGGLFPTLALILPHGIIELSAFFLVGGIAYRISWRLIAYLRGADSTPITRGELRDALVLTLLSVVAIAVAAWIEATLTREIARLLVGDGVG